jgi:hypothetical protein
MSKLISKKELRRQLDYDPKTGEFRWLIRKMGRRMNRPPGSISKVGGTDYMCRRITINDRTANAHQWAFYWMTGRWPLKIDHIDENPLNNRWSNLREVTHSENNIHKKPTRPGLTGAVFHKPSGLWGAQIYKDGKRYSLGYFKTAEEAHQRYLAAAKELHGDFSYYS